MRNQSTHYDHRSRNAGALSTFFAAIAVCFGATTVYAQTCAFDDGNSALTREGLVLTR